MANPEPNAIYEQMQFDYDVAGSAVEAAVAKLEAAIKQAESLAGNKRADFVTVGVTDLNVARELVPDAIAKVAVARGSAKIAAYDMPSVKAHKQEILNAIDQIKKWEKQVLKLDTTAGKLAKAAFAAEDKFGDLGKEYSGWVQQAAKITTELAPDQPTVSEALDGIHAKALKCVESRNTNGLKLAVQDANGLATKRFEDGLAAVDELFKKIAKAQSEVSMDTRKENMRAFSETNKRRSTLVKDVEHFKSIKQALKALKATPLNLDLALKTLGLPSSNKAALAKALVGDDNQMTKALDPLGKTLKPAKLGKDLFAALRKAKVV